CTTGRRPPPKLTSRRRGTFSRLGDGWKMSPCRPATPTSRMGMSPKHFPQRGDVFEMSLNFGDLGMSQRLLEASRPVLVKSMKVYLLFREF
ncbi:hypothetical protein KI387_020137, partial [Taxus chinensis]